MKYLAAVLLISATAGCASSSGVHQAGPGLFTVNATASHGAGGSAKAKSTAYSDAQKECGKSNTSVQVVSEQVKAPTWTDGMHSINLVFRCA